MHTKIYILIDRSGSMTCRAHQVVAGYNEFLRKQKALQLEGATCDVSTYFFSDAISIHQEDLPLGETIDLTIDQFQPGGMTALRDATAHIYRRILDEDEIDGMRRIVLILTDGMENASREVTTGALEALRTAVSTRAEIIYMGSNQDATAVGESVGSTRNASLNYNDENLLDAIDSAGDAITRVRTGATPTVAFTEVERARSSGDTVML